MQIKDHIIVSHFIPYLAMIKPENKFHLLMDVTNVCRYNCDICYKKSGNRRMALDDYKAIISDAARNDRAIKNITLTGGEPTELYSYFQTSDLREMLQYAYDHCMGVWLKTNAGWTLKPEADMIWQDFEALKRHGRRLCMDLSLDVFHRDAVVTTNNVLDYICHSKNLKDKTSLDLTCVGPDKTNIETVLEKENLARMGLNLVSRRKVKQSRRGLQDYCEECKINETSVTLSYNGVIVQVENAKKNGIGIPERTPDLAIISNAGHIILWYDHSQKVHIGNKHKPGFTIPYINADGTIKTVNKIAEEFAGMIFQKCKETLIADIREPKIRSGLEKLQRRQIDAFLPYYWPTR